MTTNLKVFAWFFCYGAISKLRVMKIGKMLINVP